MIKTHVSVWGRNLEDYTKMFNLQDLPSYSKIISVADGPSTLNLELREIGICITSVDPTYSLSTVELKEVFAKSFEFNKQLFKEQHESFNFRNDAEIEQHLAKRKKTFTLFLKDYEQYKLNYHYGKLPSLAFEASSFDLCLCSNFLFIFDHLFDMDFHLSSIKEMLRISSELRIFPIYNSDGQESAYLSPIIDYLNGQNLKWEIILNDYHIYKSGNRFLKISRL